MAELWKNYQERLSSGIPFFRLFRELIAEVGKQSSSETRRFLEGILQEKGNESMSDVEAAEQSNEISFWEYLVCKAAYCVKRGQLFQGRKYAIITYRLIKIEEVDALNMLIAEESYQRIRRELAVNDEKVSRLIADQKNEANADRGKSIFEEVLLARWESGRREELGSVMRFLEEELGFEEYRKIVDVGLDAVRGDAGLEKWVGALQSEANIRADWEKDSTQKKWWQVGRRPRSGSANSAPQNS